tara:strand:+ start:1739 stop:1951 length:213 start_codon:yes stop_codon:yes gene_type:complete
MTSPEKEFMNKYALKECIRYFNYKKEYASTRKIEECYRQSGRVNFYTTRRELERNGEIKRIKGYGWTVIK